MNHYLLFLDININPFKSVMEYGNCRSGIVFAECGFDCESVIIFFKGGRKVKGEILQ